MGRLIFDGGVEFGMAPAGVLLPQADFTEWLWVGVERVEVDIRNGSVELYQVHRSDHEQELHKYVLDSFARVSNLIAGLPVPPGIERLCALRCSCGDKQCQYMVMEQAVVTHYEVMHASVTFNQLFLSSRRIARWP